MKFADFELFPKHLLVFQPADHNVPSFLITYEFDLYTSDIEGIIGGFKSVPILKINYETTQLGEVCLGNPNNYIHVSGSSIVTTTTTAINLTFLLENDQVASYTFANNIKINLAEI